MKRILLACLLAFGIAPMLALSGCGDSVPKDNEGVNEPPPPPPPGGGPTKT